MEKQLTKTVQKKIFAFFVASLVFIGGAQSLSAMPDSTLNAVKGVEISYEGSKDKLLVFKVEYKNEISQDFQLIIRNDLNEIFYAKKFDASPLSSSIYLAELPEN